MTESIARRWRFAAPATAFAALLVLTAAAPASRATARPGLFRIELQATAQAPGGAGVANLAPAESPFGMPLTPDGHFIFDVEVTTTGLPAPSTLGSQYTQYVAWAVKDDLSEAKQLGIIKGSTPVNAQVSYNKFLLFVSAEGATVGAKWAGPVVMRGFAPSALLENFSGMTMFNGGMPQ